MPIGAPGKPTLVSPVRMPCWPVRNAARPAVHDLLAVIVEEHDAVAGDAVDVRRVVAHQPMRIRADVRYPDVVAVDDEDVRLGSCVRGLRPRAPHRRDRSQRRRRSKRRSGKEKIAPTDALLLRLNSRIPTPRAVGTVTISAHHSLPLVVFVGLDDVLGCSTWLPTGPAVGLTS
jgi:hypothetical protein